MPGTSSTLHLQYNNLRLLLDKAGTLGLCVGAGVSSSKISAGYLANQHAAR